MSGCHDTMEGRATGLSRESADPLHLLTIIEAHGHAMLKELQTAGYQVRSIEVMPHDAKCMPVLTKPMTCISLPKVSVTQ